ncbi:unnamed protein product [Amoebophrya sp. A25]|nr:unnamed protein product [Amoebophrya sp. A25]|eukprot:GSA25T00005136001.1
MLVPSDDRLEQQEGNQRETLLTRLRVLIWANLVLPVVLGFFGFIFLGAYPPENGTSCRHVLPIFLHLIAIYFTHKLHKDLYQHHYKRFIFEKYGIELEDDELAESPNIAGSPHQRYGKKTAPARTTRKDGSGVLSLTNGSLSSPSGMLALTDGSGSTNEPEKKEKRKVSKRMFPNGEPPEPAPKKENLQERVAKWISRQKRKGDAASSMGDGVSKRTKAFLTRDRKKQIVRVGLHFLWIYELVAIIALTMITWEHCGMLGESTGEEEEDLYSGIFGTNRGRFGDEDYSHPPLQNPYDPEKELTCCRCPGVWCPYLVTQSEVLNPDCPCFEDVMRADLIAADLAIVREAEKLEAARNGTVLSFLPDGTRVYSINETARLALLAHNAQTTSTSPAPFNPVLNVHSCSLRFMRKACVGVICFYGDDAAYRAAVPEECRGPVPNPDDFPREDTVSVRIATTLPPVSTEITTAAPVYLPPDYSDCLFDDWGPWGTCSQECCCSGLEYRVKTGTLDPPQSTFCSRAQINEMRACNRDVPCVQVEVKVPVQLACEDVRLKYQCEPGGYSCLRRLSLGDTVMLDLLSSERGFLLPEQRATVVGFRLRRDEPEEHCRRLVEVERNNVRWWYSEESLVHITLTVAVECPHEFKRLGAIVGPQVEPECPLIRDTDIMSYAETAATLTTTTDPTAVFLGVDAMVWDPIRGEWRSKSEVDAENAAKVKVKERTGFELMSDCYPYLFVPFIALLLETAVKSPCPERESEAGDGFRSAIGVLGIIQLVCRVAFLWVERMKETKDKEGLDRKHVIHASAEDGEGELDGNFRRPVKDLMFSREGMVDSTGKRYIERKVTPAQLHGLKGQPHLSKENQLALDVKRLEHQQDRRLRALIDANMLRGSRTFSTSIHERAQGRRQAVMERGPDGVFRAVYIDSAPTPPPEEAFPVQRPGEEQVPEAFREWEDEKEFPGQSRAGMFERSVYRPSAEAARAAAQERMLALANSDPRDENETLAPTGGSITGASQRDAAALEGGVSQHVSSVTHHTSSQDLRPVSDRQSRGGSSRGDIDKQSEGTGTSRGTLPHRRPASSDAGDPLEQSIVPPLPFFPPNSMPLSPGIEPSTTPGAQALSKEAEFFMREAETRTIESTELNALALVTGVQDRELQLAGIIAKREKPTLPPDKEKHDGTVRLAPASEMLRTNRLRSEYEAQVFAATGRSGFYDRDARSRSGAATPASSAGGRDGVAKADRRDSYVCDNVGHPLMPVRLDDARKSERKCISCQTAAREKKGVHVPVQMLVSRVNDYCLCNTCAKMIEGLMSCWAGDITQEDFKQMGKMVAKLQGKSYIVDDEVYTICGSEVMFKGRSIFKLRAKLHMQKVEDVEVMRPLLGIVTPEGDIVAVDSLKADGAIRWSDGDMWPVFDDTEQQRLRDEAETRHQQAEMEKARRIAEEEARNAEEERRREQQRLAEEARLKQLEKQRLEMERRLMIEKGFDPDDMSDGELEMARKIIYKQGGADDD